MAILDRIGLLAAYVATGLIAAVFAVYATEPPKFVTWLVVLLAGAAAALTLIGEIREGDVLGTMIKYLLTATLVLLLIWLFVRPATMIGFVPIATGICMLWTALGLTMALAFSDSQKRERAS